MSNKPLSVDLALIKAKTLIRNGVPGQARQLYQAVLSRFPGNKRAIDVNPGAKLVSFPERYWPVYWRLVASAPHVADARQGALAGGQFRAASLVV